MTRWPVPRWGIVAVLAIYGGMTEIIQGYVPHENAEMDGLVSRLDRHCVGNGVLLGRRDAYRHADRSETKSAAPAVGVVR